jgi:glycosyltransferase involved in cell wall biosynthesis
MKEDIILSVVIPNFNHASYLEARIKSILDQFESNMELIIIDDGSTDNSIEIIEKFSLIDARVRLIRLEKNGGVNNAVNIGLNHAKGKYASFLSADDIILEGFFRKTLDLLISNPSLGICCSNFGYTNHDNPNQFKATILIKNLKSEVVFKTPQDALMAIRTNRMFIPGHTSILKKSSILKKGGFNETYNFASDWYLNNAIALEEGFGYIPETLSVMRFLPNSYSAVCFKNKILKKNTYWALLNMFFKNENKTLYNAFLKGRLLDDISKTMLFSLIHRPKYWPFLLTSYRLKYIGKIKKIILKLIRVID